MQIVDVKSIVHFIPNDKFANELVEVIYSTNQNIHFFLIGGKEKISVSYITYINRFKGLIKFAVNMTKLYFTDSPVLVVHCLDIPLIKIFLIPFLIHENAQLIWHIRGTDLYAPTLSNEYPFFYKIVDLIITKRFNSVVTNFNYDFLLAKNLYGIKKKKLMICSPSNCPEKINEEKFNTLLKDKNDEVIVGNSATISSNSLEILRNHSELFSINDKLNFIFIGSYGHKSYLNELEKNNFFSNVNIQKDFLSNAQFSSWISNFKFALLSPKRIQGAGVLMSLLQTGCTIYTFKNSPIDKYLSQFNFHYKLLEVNATKMTQLSDEKLKSNYLKVNNEFNKKFCKKQWNTFHSEFREL